MDHLVYVCRRRTAPMRALSRLLACSLAGHKVFCQRGENLCFLAERDERGLRESTTMIKGKQTGAGTKHNEIIRDVVAVVVCLFFPALFPLPSRRLALAVHIYFQNEDAETSANTCWRSFDDLDVARKWIAIIRY